MSKIASSQGVLDQRSWEGGKRNYKDLTIADLSAPPVRRITVNMLKVKVLNNKGLANRLAPSHAFAGAIL